MLSQVKALRFFLGHQEISNGNPIAIYTPIEYYSSMDTKTKKSCLNRLARIEGQVRGVRNMVEEDRYCIEILTQINAARAALDRVEQEILREHLQSCVTHAFHNGSLKERNQKIDELIRVLDSQRR